MPGATSLGIRYPLQGETVDANSWQTMAQDIDALLTSLDTLRDLTVTPPTAGVSIFGTSVTLATGVTGVLTFDTEQWDNAAYANLGVNNDRFTVPAGVYYVKTDIELTGFTSLTGMRATFLVGGATLWGGYTHGNTGTASNPTLNLGSVVVGTALTNSIQVQVRWDGTGGPASFNFGTMSIYQIRTLVNV